ncbi:hypothetical protein [uncultured Treponema sp.]|uniref:hypothetical protein n=2 Tax=Treponema TaxID=157 RepID=UPI0026392683|nr:hypothetical protein [uncultured Treponema sp.]
MADGSKEGMGRKVYSLNLVYDDEDGEPIVNTTYVDPTSVIPLDGSVVDVVGLEELAQEKTLQKIERYTAALYNQVPNFELINSIHNVMPTKENQVSINVSVDAVKSSVDEVKSSVDEVKSSEDEVKLSVDAVKSSVDAVKSSVDAVKSSEDAVKSSVDAVKSSVDAVKSSVDEVKSEMVSTIYNKIGAVENSVDSVGSALDNMFDDDSGYVMRSQMRLVLDRLIDEDGSSVAEDVNYVLQTINSRFSSRSSSLQSIGGNKRYSAGTVFYFGTNRFISLRSDCITVSVGSEFLLLGDMSEYNNGTVKRLDGVKFAQSDVTKIVA